MNNLIKLLFLSVICGTSIISCGGGGGGGDPVQPETTETMQPETTETMQPEMVDNDPPPIDPGPEVCVASACQLVKNPTSECFNEYPLQPITNQCAVTCVITIPDNLCEDGLCDTSGDSLPACFDSLDDL